MRRQKPLGVFESEIPPRYEIDFKKSESAYLARHEHGIDAPKVIQKMLRDREVEPQRIGQI